MTNEGVKRNELPYHRDEIEWSEEMRLLKARKYALPDTASFEEIDEEYERRHFVKMANLLELPETASFEEIRAEVKRRGLNWVDITQYADLDIDLDPRPSEVKAAVERSQLESEKLLLEVSLLMQANEETQSNEKSAEKVLNEREVLNVLEEIVGGGEYEIVRREEDEDGLKRLDITTKGEDGEIVKYDYTRDDNAGETVIDVVFFMGDIPCGGHPVQKYKEGVWVPEVD